eukprot:3522503-Pleurochrysis_carterae.AAC.1
MPLSELVGLCVEIVRLIDAPTLGVCTAAEREKTFSALLDAAQLPCGRTVPFVAVAVRTRSSHGGTQLTAAAAVIRPCCRLLALPLPPS